MRVYTSQEMLCADYGDKDHPEKPARVSLIRKMIDEQGIEIFDVSELDDADSDEDMYESDIFDIEDERDITEEQEAEEFLHREKEEKLGSLEDHIRLAHSKRYITELAERAETFRTLQEGIGGMNSRKALYAAREAVSLTLEGAFYIENSGDNRKNKAFATVRPPGHHAGRDYGHGFCLFNNAAIAAKYLSRNGKRVMIIDIDLHFGDGTADIVKGDTNILYVSLHHKDCCLVDDRDFREYDNIELFRLNDGADDNQFVRILERRIKPLALRYRPEVYVISAGFDCMESDYGALNPGEGLRITERSIESLCRIVENKAALFVLEGGYKPISVKRGFETILRHF